MSNIIFHIDVNSAYLSWSSVERLKNGDTVDLRDIPSIIGGNRESRHGIVLAKSLSAKALGIKTGEPVAMALRKCPTLIIEPPDHAMYSRYSKLLMDYLRTITPDIQQVSIDECYMDFTPIADMYPSPKQLAATIQDHVLKNFGFTVNVGIAPNKLLAKMASDFEKPNKIHTLFENEIPDKMWPLPVSELFMTGKSSVKRLNQIGIFTIGELAHTDVSYLEREFKSKGRQMWEYANGIDDSKVESGTRDLKGVGNSITLANDVDDRTEAKAVLLSLAESVSGRLRKYHQLAQSLTVEIRYSDFVNNSHQMQLSSPTNLTDMIYSTACRLFDELWNGRPIRLLGIRSSKLLPDNAPVQLSIFDMLDQPSAKVSTKNAEKKVPDPKLQKAESAIDEIRRRFGNDSIVRGSLLNSAKGQHFTDNKKEWRNTDEQQ